MSFFKNRSKDAIFQRMREAEFYRIVVEELSSDGKDPAAWGMALVQAQGDQGKAEAEYIKIRVEMLKDLADLHQHIDNQRQAEVVHSVTKTSPPSEPKPKPKPNSVFQPRAHRSYPYSYDINSGLSCLDQTSCATKLNDDLSDLPSLEFPSDLELKEVINSRIAAGVKAYKGYVYRSSINTGEAVLDRERTLSSVGDKLHSTSLRFASIQSLKDWIDKRSKGLL